MEKKRKSKGINVMVSPEAHEAMVKQAFTHKPRLKLRGYVNLLNKLPINK